MRSDASFKNTYRTAFDAYLQQGGEEGLTPAHEIACEALARGMSMAEAIKLHFNCAEALAADTPLPDQRELSRTFILEVSDVFDKALREAREANDRLTREINELRCAETALGQERDTLERRVDERTATLSEQRTALLRANADLERCNSELEDFAYIASHDLREPLRAICSNAGILSETAVDVLEPEDQQLLLRITELTERLDNLMAELLAYSRIDRATAEREQVDLGAVITEIAEDHAEMFLDRRVVLTCSDKLPVCECSPSAARIIFQNLIMNGVKYNRSDVKRIEIGMKVETGATGSRRVYFVKDNGVGICPRHFDDVFRIFKRLNSRKDFGEGNGVGLAFARKSIENLGGSIWIESEVGAGSTFFFTLGG